MKKAILLLLLLCVPCFSACNGQQSLIDRAVVQAVHIDYHVSKFVVTLCVAQITPGADTAKTEVSTATMTADGATVPLALQAVQQTLSEELFFEQNELLFLTENAAAHYEEISEYFCREDVLKTNMYVYLVPENTQAFCDQADRLTEFLEKTERLAQRGDTQQRLSTRIYQMRNHAFWLPQLGSIRGEPTVQTVQIFADGRQQFACEGEKLHAVMLLDGSLDVLRGSTGTYAYEAEAFAQSYEVQLRDGVPCLTVTLYGTLKNVSTGNRRVTNENALRVARVSINRSLTRQLQTAADNTFGAGVDLYEYVFYFRQWNVVKTVEMLCENTLYLPQNVRVQCELK